VNSFPGEYFVTICTRERECILGEIFDDEMKLNARGIIADKCWREIPEHFPNVGLDEFVIMPNHVHGIIILNEHCRGEVTSPLRKPTLGKVVAFFKYQSTKMINELNATQGNRFWQRGFYDRIIRNHKELNNIRDYIANNVLDWLSDTENPNNIPL
jgi:REP element-mobilizing transposase RayT